MPPRPNFTGVARKDQNLILSGASEGFEGIRDIHVILTQDNKIQAEDGIKGAIRVTRIGTTWSAIVPAAGFVKGPAVAFGVETRDTEPTTTAWAEEVTIP
jgi:hypothetical protein